MRNYYPESPEYLDPTQKKLRPMFDLQQPPAPGPMDWGGHLANQDYGGGGQQQEDPYDLGQLFGKKKAPPMHESIHGIGSGAAGIPAHETAHSIGSLAEGASGAGAAVGGMEKIGAMFA